MPVIQALKKDIPSIVALLNAGYRGEISKKGWTHEADLITGEIRTNEKTVESLMNKPGAIFLKATDDKGKIRACVYLQKQMNRLYLGMLCVDPILQAKGIGKELMEAASRQARDMHCDTIYMKVISVRKELIAWYERQGYQRTGIKEPFPDESEFGIPTQKLEFEIFEKKIS